MLARVMAIVLTELTAQAEQPHVMRSQLIALRKQLPLLYLTLCTNAVALCYTHLGVAPRFLTIVAPAALIPACLLRVLFWHRMQIPALIDAEIKNQLRRTILLVAALGVCFTAWSHAMFLYGDDYAKAHVLFFMGITVVGCIFCLIHLRPAALLLTFIVTTPFVIHFGASGNPILVALAVNLLIVAIVMTFMLLAYYDDFRRLVHSTKELAILSDEHQRAAQTDSLTGLANRRKFFDDFVQEIEVSDRLGTSFALGVVDLDGFKPINDLHGHSTGDHVLIEISRRLATIVRMPAAIARLGGDEFGLLVRANASTLDLESLGRDLCDTLAKPIDTNRGSLTVTASVGFAVFPSMGRSREQLFERADFALYHAKEHRRGSSVVFTEQHAAEIGERHRLEYELRHADLAVEMWTAFQPIIDVNRSRVIAFEALARWDSPVLGTVSPGRFIPAAERIGTIGCLTQNLFKKACASAMQWPSEIDLSFNLSVDDLVDVDSARKLTTMISECGLPAGRLIFEITETAIMRDCGRASATLQALRGLGCRIALDDFGTGYSSLSHVNQLRLDKMKIDQSFVRSLSAERSSRSVIEAICGLAARLSIDCIIEGVETAEQMRLLRSIGCPTMQGYYFGKPMRSEEALLYLQSQDAAAFAA